MNGWVRRDRPNTKWHKVVTELGTKTYTFCKRSLKAPKLIFAEVPPPIDIHRLEVCHICWRAR